MLVMGREEQDRGAPPSALRLSPSFSDELFSVAMRSRYSSPANSVFGRKLTSKAAFKAALMGNYILL